MTFEQAMLQLQEKQEERRQAAEALETATQSVEEALQSIDPDHVRPHLNKLVRVGDWAYRFTQLPPCPAASLETHHVPDLASDPIFEPPRRKGKRKD